MSGDTSATVADIRVRYSKVMEEIAAAARRAGRSEDSVRLVVVTKSQPVSVVEAAIEAGAQILGESYPEEAAAKIRAVRGVTSQPPSDPNRRPEAATQVSSVEWHMIGHVQGRKAKLVAPNFDMLHSLDSLKLGERLDQLAGEGRRKLAVLLEFNLGGEPAKYGWSAADEDKWSRMLEDVQAILGLSNLAVQGLMTMPPLAANPEGSREYFRKLRRLRDYLSSRAPGTQWHELSMGTSADFSVAVEEGATLVRVGEAILGPRPQREHA